MRYFMILSVLVIAAPVMQGSFANLFSAYACDGCTEPEPEPEPQNINEAHSAGDVSDVCKPTSILTSDIYVIADNRQIHCRVISF
jgi:hypothetical protein